jgi:hypothetical protein
MGKETNDTVFGRDDSTERLKVTIRVEAPTDPATTRSHVTFSTAELIEKVNRETDARRDEAKRLRESVIERRGRLQEWSLVTMPRSRRTFLVQSLAEEDFRVHEYHPGFTGHGIFQPEIYEELLADGTTHERRPDNHWQPVIAAAGYELVKNQHKRLLSEANESASKANLRAELKQSIRKCYVEMRNAGISVDEITTIVESSVRSAEKAFQKKRPQSK